IVMVLTGLGTVTPAISDGAVGPSTTLSYADLYNSKSVAVYFNDCTNSIYKQGTVGYAGLAPFYAALYQLNVTLPTRIRPSITRGVYVEISTDFADITQVQIPVGTSAGVTSRPESLQHPSAPPRRQPRGTRRDSSPPRQFERGVMLLSAQK